MNVLEMLDKELQKRQDYTLDLKKRYLYLRTCQMFSYDSRYHFCTYEFLKEKAETLQAEILNKKINPEDVTDFKVVCKPYSKYIYSTALKELLNVDNEVVGDGHCWVEFDNRQMKADATTGDLSRAKFKLPTYGYKPIVKDESYKEKLKEIDQGINYIDSNYDNVLLIGLMGIGYHNLMQKTDWVSYFNSLPEKEQTNLINEVLKQEVEIKRRGWNNIVQNLTTSKEYFNLPLADELLISKYDKVRQAISNYNYLASNDKNYYHLSEYEDAKIIVDYLLSKLNIELIPTISLFQDYDDKDWEFVNIYPIHLEKFSIYYALERDTDVYTFHEVSEKKARIYIKELKGKNKETFYHRQY